MLGKVAVIGGTGGMGQWLAKLFKAHGFEVIISGRDPEKARRVAGVLGVKHASSNLEAVRGADVVGVATPIETMAETIRGLLPNMKRGALIFDIASVKGETTKALEEAVGLGLRAVSLHPLFGPGVVTPRGKRILAIPLRSGRQIPPELSPHFEEEGLIVEWVESGEAHDEAVALTLSLPHLLNMIFGEILRSWDVKEVKRLGGTTFSLQLLVAESVFSENPNLYSSIQLDNPAFKRVVGELRGAVERWSGLVLRGEREGFVKAFEEVRRSLARDPAFAEAYQRFQLAFEASR